MSGNYLYDADMIREQLPKIIQPGRLFNVRLLNAVTPGNATGWTYNKVYDISQVDDIIADLAALDLKRCSGIYYTPNEADRAMRPSLYGYGKPGLQIRNCAVSDRDIRRRNYILIDIDPERPAGTMADESQTLCAYFMYDAICRLMRESFAGNVDCHTVFSGNGFQMLYPTDLPAGSQYPKMLLEALKALSNDAVKVDATVSNASRIFRMPGTLNCKGPDSSAWRMCELTGVASEGAFLSADALKAVLGEDHVEGRKPEKYLPDDTSEAGLLGFDLRPGLAGSFDLDAFMEEHFPDARQEAYGESTRWIIGDCPLGDHDHHMGEAVVIQGGDGTIAYKCSHDTCTGKRWQDLRAHFDKAYAARLEAAAGNIDNSRY